MNDGDNEFVRNLTLMSRIERKYCLISTSHLAGILFDIFILLHI